MFLFSIAFNLFTPQSHSFDGQRIVELGMNPRQSHLKRPVWLWSNVHICGQNRISPLLLYQVSHDVEGRQKDLLNPSQRESLAQHLEQIKTLAPILICSMKIFIQILNQVAINLSKLVLFRKTKWCDCRRGKAPTRQLRIETTSPSGWPMKSQRWFLLFDQTWTWL